jgi:predicted RNA-binding Zn-ribbon protein involved in translation (DUF1610 family)
MDMSEAQFTLSLIALIVLGVCATVVVFSVRRLYRCPHCEKTPMITVALLGPASFGVRRDLVFNPFVCPNCGAKLRTDA